MNAYAEAQREFTIAAAVRGRKAARWGNAYEAYVYSLRNTLDESATQQALSDEDRTALKEMVDSALAWLDDNQSAEKEEYDARRRELEEAAIPILQKSKAAAGAGPSGDGDAAGADGAPDIEEVGS